MKSLKFYIFTLLFISSAGALYAQNGEIPNEIVSALNSGDAGKLSGYLNTNVELAISNKNDVFSKQQATGIISDFFRTNHVQSFQVLHSGTKDTSSFAIGTLKTSGGSFRVYVLVRKSGGQTVIHQLRIEPSNG